MAIISLAIRSLVNRRFTALLTVLAIAMSVTLLLGVEQIRREAKSSFANTISGTDLIVGARSGTIQLLLYSVFRIGNATNNIAWDSYQELAANPKVSWTIPLSLGDSHRGFRVLGTNGDYFVHYRYARDRQLTLAAGRPFTGLFEAVLGAEVAETLEYTLHQDIVIAHGVGAIGLSRHDDKPFRVVGILAKTGTPVDRTVHVSLESIEAIHVDWQGGARIPGMAVSAEQVRQLGLTPKTITAFMVGLHSKISTFSVQRAINEYRGEPLLAILPGVALQELWDLMSVAEQALMAISVFVVITGLIGMLTVILASLNERRREMAILRSVGARPTHIFGLLMTEAGL
ncbi:MAG: ABC transporter permease, partial [Candidatus Competibacteraceae bacterium]|nr:ABC transporter permease [Candidatus Competibacteraceae bacterium]